MVLCAICSSPINEDGQYYLFENMGPDISSTIENMLGHEMGENGTMCANCFSNIMQRISTPASALHDEIKLEIPEIPCDTNVCIWCQSSLYTRRSHSLPEGPEKRFISERISPQVIPIGSLVCYACWVRVRRILQQETAVKPESSVSSTTINTNICVWCLRSLASTRRHSIPDGPERNEILAKIFPREIPSGGSVCYACWVAARRNIQRAETLDQKRQDLVCAICSTSLFRRQTHTLLPSGPERDEVAERIYPRELPGHSHLCTPCWIQTRENVHILHENVKHTATNMSTMQLDQFTHTTSSSTHCFVPTCGNSERLRVPDYLRKRILLSRKIFVTENSRICNKHKKCYNWDFLDQHEFSSTFTKTEMESMLSLSIKEIYEYIDFENIDSIDENLFVYWTGLTKEAYFNVLNTISPGLTCTNLQTALGVYFIKAHTGGSHEKISSLLCLSTSSLTRLIKEFRGALLRLFVPLHT